MTNVTMAILVQPTITSKLTPNQAFESDNVILHALLSDILTTTLQYWIITSYIITTLTQYWKEAGNNVLYFIPFSTKVAWKRIYTDQPLTNTISIILTKTSPLKTPPLSSLMSTSPTSATHPTHNYPSNMPAKPTTSLIALMNKTIQQNATMMEHLQTQPSPPLVQPTPIAPEYKLQRYPSTKLDGTPPTTPLFLGQV